MTDDPNAPAPSPSADPAAPLLPAAVGAVPALTAVPRVVWVVLAVAAALSVASLAVAWKAEQRGASLEQEIVRRQQESTATATEARAAAKQAQDGAAEATAKVALLDARVAEVSVQRGQLDELIQTLARSRDENVLVDLEAGIRVALQQSAITGSGEPLVAALKQADERLARYSQPRLEGVRRAIGRDLDRVRATGTADAGSLGVKLDEAIRLVDELPLLAAAEPRPGGNPRAPAASPAGASADAANDDRWNWSTRLESWNALGERVWEEVRSLVRVTRIDHPEAMLLAPEQSFFVRENLKLRLLNARLALLSRQFDTAQADLRAAQTALDRYFDRSAKRTVLATDLIRQVSGQARQVVVPRPDDTLAALAAASAGR